jgi:RNA polymerase sigma factor (sigma-70 family)
MRAEKPRGQADRYARDRFVLDYDRLACSLAGKFRWSGEDMEDLQQVAREALVVAAHRFDPRHGVRFGTYAYRFVWGRLMHHIRDEVRLIRHPRPAHMAGRPYLQMVSLDALPGSAGGQLELEEMLGAVDPGFDAVENTLTIQQMLEVRAKEPKAALATDARQLTGSSPNQNGSKSGGAVPTSRRQERAIQRPGQKVA